MSRVWTESQISNRIDGNQEASPGQFPYVVSLRLNSSSNQYKHICGGAILSDRYVLTTAHCVRSNRYKLFALVGLYARDDVDERNLYEIEKGLVHEKFDREKTFNDIALLKTKTPIRWQ